MIYHLIVRDTKKEIIEMIANMSYEELKKEIFEKGYFRNCDFSEDREEILGFTIITATKKRYAEKHEKSFVERYGLENALKKLEV